MKSGSAVLLTVLGASFCFGVSVGYAVTGGLVDSAAKEGIQRVESSALEAYDARDGESQFAGEGHGIEKRSIDWSPMSRNNKMVRRTVKSAAARRGADIQTKPFPITEGKTTKSSRMSDSAVREQSIPLSPWRNSPVAALDTISNLLPALQALTQSVSRSITRSSATPNRRNALRLGLRGRTSPFRSDWYEDETMYPDTSPPFLPIMPPFIPEIPIGSALPPFEDEIAIISAEPDFIGVRDSALDFGDEYGELDLSDGDVEYISGSQEELGGGGGGDGGGDGDVDVEEGGNEEGGPGMDLTLGTDVDAKPAIPPKLWEAVMKSISRAAEDF